VPKPKVSPIATVAAAAATASAVPAMAKSAKPVAPRDRDDDYLKCEEYHGHKVTDEANNVAFFSHTNNKEYFVVYGDDDAVLIRSEGFDSISKRSSELAAVLRLKDDSKNFTRIEKSGYFIDVLKDENGREVGRSCVRKIAPIAAAAPVAATPIAAAGAAAVATGGGFSWGWLKWLLPLLLLLLLAFFGLKACSGDKTDLAAKAAATQKLAADKAEAAKALAAEKAAQAEKVAAEKAAALKKAADEKAAAAAAALAAKAETVVATPAPKPVVVAANMSRVCGASDRSVFNVPSFATPVTVTRLGTYPQFGDSHTLTPSEFYDKLANRYAVNNYDRQYLDYLAKSLGYKNGFSDVSASDFSNDALQKGAKGLLGYGEFHGTTYSQLNVISSRDLEAFRLRAANGMDVHFMKSCGNYMYVCQ